LGDALPNDETETALLGGDPFDNIAFSDDE
jgi:hypothetical protein